jgi:uncharacterized protein YbjT (DUF2867 family)
MAETVLVTGGTGFVAGWCIAELLERGHDVRTSLRSITVSLGRRNRHTTAKAERILGWQPRPAAQTVLDCARSLLEWQVV